MGYATYTLMGAESRNPKLPRQSVEVEFILEPTCFKLVPHNGAAPLVVHWEHLKETNWDQAGPQGCLGTLAILVLLHVTLFLIYPIMMLAGPPCTYVFIDFWDEEYQLDSSIVLYAGVYNSGRAKSLINTLWAWRGSYYQSLRYSVTPQY
jgi:hypothetical protein